MKVIYSLFIYIQALLYFLILGPLMLFIAIFIPKYTYSFGRIFCKGVFKVFHVKYNIIGEFPNSGPYILMHNHTSFLDLFFYQSLLKENIPA